MAARNQERAKTFVAAGVPQKLARRLAQLPDLSEAADILAVASESGASLEAAAQSYYSAADRFQIARLEALAHGLQTNDYYDELALDGALQVLAEAHRRIVMRMIAEGGSFAASGMQKQNVDRIMRRLSTLTEAEGLSVSRVIVAADLLADLAKA
jgi:glutamate dehydrogenase